MGSICIAENNQGVVDRVFRKFQLTARQSVQRFGATALRDKIVGAAAERPDTQHDFPHAVPAMTVLPEFKMVNEMSKTVLRAGQRALDPPLLLQEDGALSGFDLRPGALNFGGVHDQGNAVGLPLDLNSRVDIDDEMIGSRQKAINEPFLVTLRRRWSPHLA